MRYSSLCLVVVVLISGGESLAQSCSVRVTSMQFGQYNPLSGNLLDATADVYVNCDTAISYKVMLDAGANAEGNFSTRRMVSADGNYSLNYNIYRDSNHIEIWGDGTGNTFTHSGLGTGKENHHIAYGRVSGRQNVPVGVYGDILSVRIEW